MPRAKTTKGVLLEHLGEALRAAEQFSVESQPLDEPWEGARKDVADLRHIIRAALDVATTLVMNRDSDVLERGLRESVEHARKIVGALRPLLRTDRAKGEKRSPTSYPPIESDDLIRDLKRCSLSALPWQGTEPPDKESRKKLAELRELKLEARVDQRVREGWRNGDINRLVRRTKSLLLEHGHLLGRDPPQDLDARLQSAINKVRERTEPRLMGEDNFVEAVLKAYGLTAEDAASRARVK